MVVSYQLHTPPTLTPGEGTTTELQHPLTRRWGATQEPLDVLKRERSLAPLETESQLLDCPAHRLATIPNTPSWLLKHS